MEPNLGMSLGKKRTGALWIAIHTTLYELVKSISEEVPEGEDHLVAEVITQLLQEGRVKFLGDPRTIETDFRWEHRTGSTSEARTLYQTLKDETGDHFPLQRV